MFVWLIFIGIMMMVISGLVILNRVLWLIKWLSQGLW